MVAFFEISFWLTKTTYFNAIAIDAEELSLPPNHDVPIHWKIMVEIEYSALNAVNVLN